MSDRPETNPARIVADADVLVADLLVGSEARRASEDAGGERSDNRGGAARTAMDQIRSHSWVELIASDQLLDDAEAVIEELADEALATAWREKIEAVRVRVEHPAGDHPALASAYRGGAAHLLSYDETLRDAKAGATLGSRLNISPKTPEGFVELFDAESLYEAVEGGTYPGPDADPRE